MNGPVLTGACVATLGLSTGALGELIGVLSTNEGDLGAGADSIRLWILFDHPGDQLLSISGNASDHNPLIFQSTTPLIQNQTLFGTVLGDTPAFDAGGDSWVTIGTADPFADMAFSPNFINDGTEEKIVGTFFSHRDNGGYFDQNPGTSDGSPTDDPDTNTDLTFPKGTGAVLIAQFTIDAGPSDFFAFEATADYNNSNGQLTSVGFNFVTPSPGVIPAFLLLGLTRTRRRAGVIAGARCLEVRHAGCTSPSLGRERDKELES